MLAFASGADATKATGAGAAGYRPSFKVVLHTRSIEICTSMHTACPMISYITLLVRGHYRIYVWSAIRLSQVSRRGADFIQELNYVPAPVANGLPRRMKNSCFSAHQPRATLGTPPYESHVPNPHLSLSLSTTKMLTKSCEICCRDGWSRTAINHRLKK